MWQCSWYKQTPTKTTTCKNCGKPTKVINQSHCKQCPKIWVTCGLCGTHMYYHKPQRKLLNNCPWCGYPLFTTKKLYVTTTLPNGCIKRTYTHPKPITVNYQCAFCCHKLTVRKYKGFYIAHCPGCVGPNCKGNQGPRRIIGRNLPQLWYKVRNHYRRATAYYNGICRNYLNKNSTVALCNKPCTTHSKGCYSLHNSLPNQ